MRPIEGQLDVDVPRAGVLRDVGQALLGDAVDHELLLGGQRRDVAAAAEARRRRRSLGEVGTWVRRAGSSPWSSSAVGRSSRARCRSSSIACVASVLVVSSSRRSVGGASCVGGLEAQQDRRQRLVDLVVEVLRDPLALLLLRAKHAVCGLAALGLEPVEHAVERGLSRITSSASARDARRAAASARQVGLLHRADQPLERPQAPAQQQRVGQQRDQERHHEHGELAPLAGVVDRTGRPRWPRRTPSP